MSDNNSHDLSFEDALSQLETLVEQMEHGELSLEDSLAAFERGVALTRRCEAALKAAEQKVEILSTKTLDSEPEPFDGDA
jgi:exodeoxyribonuclease VII small subunit